MRSKILRYLKIGWCVAALMILLMGTQVCTATDEACAAAGDTMFLFMLLLSFPTGVVFLTISLIFVNAGGEHYPADYILAWFIMAGAGCLQWFVVVPRLLDKPKFTLLDLRAGPVPVPAIPHLTQPPSQALVTAAKSPQIPPTVREVRGFARRSEEIAFRPLIAAAKLHSNASLIIDYKCLRMKVAIFHASIAFHGSSAVV